MYVHGTHSPGRKRGSAVVGGVELSSKDSAQVQKELKNQYKNSPASSAQWPSPAQPAHAADSPAFYKATHINLEMLSLMSSSLKIQLLSFAGCSEQAGVTRLRFHQAKCFCAVNEITFSHKLREAAYRLVTVELQACTSQLQAYSFKNYCKDLLLLKHHGAENLNWRMFLSLPLNQSKMPGSEHHHTPGPWGAQRAHWSFGNKTLHWRNDATTLLSPPDFLLLVLFLHYEFPSL